MQHGRNPRGFLTDEEKESLPTVTWALNSHGVIAQSGKHEELLQQGGIYKQLFDTQFGRMLENTD